MQNYVKSLQRHLGTYKTARLGVKEKGAFTHQGKVMHYAHVLPKELKWLNIVEPVRAEVREFVESRPEIKLHKYFHHLNSSQAFALNLYCPYFSQGQSAVLLNAMGLKGSASAWFPEHVVDTAEGTNVDMSWQSPEGAWTHCEVKLSEQEFGATKDDPRHRSKLEEIYRPVLNKYCPDELLQPATFFANYQVFRNLWLAGRDQSASVVFLMPRENEALWKQIKPIINALSGDLAKRVHTVAIEDLLAKLVASRASAGRLAWIAELLLEKYVVSSANESPRVSWRPVGLSQATTSAA